MKEEHKIKLILLFLFLFFTSWIFTGCSGGNRGNKNEELSTGYKLDVKTVGLGKIIKKPDKKRYEKGDEVTLKVIPEADFINWQGDIESDKGSKIIVMDSNYKVIAHFHSKFVFIADDKLYTINEDGSRLTKLADVSNLEVKKLFYLSGEEKLYFTGHKLDKERSQIYQIDIYNGNMQQITEEAGNFNFAGGSWHSDRRQIVAAEGKDEEYKTYEIYKINFTTGDKIQLTDNNKVDYNPIWSSDGDKIIFTSVASKEEYNPDNFKEANLNLYIMDYNGKNTNKLTDIKKGHVKDLKWAAKGEKIFFTVENKDKNKSFYLINQDGSNKINLKKYFSISGNIEEVDLAPEGSKMVLIVNEDEKLQHYIGDVTGKTKIKVKESFADPIFKWGQQGKKLVVETKQEDGKPNLFIVDLKEGSVQEITAGYKAAWSEEDRVLFVREAEENKENIYYIKTHLTETKPVKLLGDQNFNQIDNLQLLTK